MMYGRYVFIHGSFKFLINGLVECLYVQTEQKVRQSDILIIDWVLKLKVRLVCISTFPSQVRIIINIKTAI